MSLLAKDNLSNLVTTCSALVTDSSFKEAVVHAAGVEAAVLDCACRVSFAKPEELVETLTALNQVFQGLVEKLPKRDYQRVSELGPIEEPVVDESVTL